MELAGGLDASALLKKWASGVSNLWLAEDAKAAVIRLSRK
jgi:hypothetical protein